MIEIQPLDLLVSVNGVSLFGTKQLGEYESSQSHFEVAVDRIVESTLPRVIRVFRLHRYTTQVCERTSACEYIMHMRSYF